MRIRRGNIVCFYQVGVFDLLFEFGDRRTEGFAEFAFAGDGVVEGDFGSVGVVIIV